MILPVVPSPAADMDLIEIMYYLSTKSPTLGDRFALAVEKTYQQLSRMPYLGELHPFKDPSMQNIRIWRVKGFPNHLIFYRVEPEQITIARLRHSATNYMEDFESS